MLPLAGGTLSWNHLPFGDDWIYFLHPLYATVPYNKKSAKQVLWQHSSPGYANLSRQIRLNCCKDADNGFMLILWWCPLKFKKIILAD
jgi:hypothetical protein